MACGIVYTEFLRKLNASAEIALLAQKKGCHQTFALSEYSPQVLGRQKKKATKLMKEKARFRVLTAVSPICLSDWQYGRETEA